MARTWITDRLVRILGAQSMSVVFNAYSGEILSGTVQEVIENLEAIQRTIERIKRKKDIEDHPKVLDTYPIDRTLECNT